MLLLKSIIKNVALPQAPRRSRPPRALRLGLALLVPLLGAGPAHANPKPLPFSYFADVQPPGAFEFEAYTDLSPVRVARTTADGTEAVTALRLDLQTEFEFGLTDSLELGWYFVFKQDASADGSALGFDGIKQRLRWQLAPSGVWPIDVALYGEVAELHDELEFEQKIILSKRMGAWRFAVNLSFEQEWAFQDDAWEFVYNPSAGVTVDLSPNVTLGLEYRLHGTFETEEEEEGGEAEEEAPTHYLGPTLLVQTGGPWFSFGAYVRLDGLGERQAIDDPNGKLWVRAILGFDI